MAGAILNPDQNDPHSRSNPLRQFVNRLYDIGQFALEIVESNSSWKDGRALGYLCKVTPDAEYCRSNQHRDNPGLGLWISRGASCTGI